MISKDILGGNFKNLIIALLAGYGWGLFFWGRTDLPVALITGFTISVAVWALLVIEDYEVVTSKEGKEFAKEEERRTRNGADS